MAKMNSKQTFLCLMSLLFAIGDCGTETWTHRRLIARRDTDNTCDKEPIEFKTGCYNPAVETSKTIKDEAEDGNHPILLNSYELLSTTHSQNYTNAKTEGQSLGLGDNETMAVFLYTMDNTKEPFFIDLNTAMRNGKNKYPIFQYWLETALRKLRGDNGQVTKTLFRGYNIHLTTTKGKKMYLPGFTSTTENRTYAEKTFSKPGCTVMILQGTKTGADIRKLSNKPKQAEVLIPPIEMFEVTEIPDEKEHGYRIIKLKPISGRKRRAAGDPGVTECPGSGTGGNPSGPSLKLITVTLMLSISLKTDIYVK